MFDDNDDSLPSAEQYLIDFVDCAKQAFNKNLKAVLLYGPAASASLRKASEVPVLLVLTDFDVSQVNQVRERLRIANAAIHLNVTFILKSELLLAIDAFSAKFTDILSHHRLIYGVDPFKDIAVTRMATVLRLKQDVIDLMLRLREHYALLSLQDELLTPIITAIYGPIHAIAVTIMSLEGKKDMSPRAALQVFTSKFPGKVWTEIIRNLETAREKRELKPGDAALTVLGLLEILSSMHHYVQKID